MASALRPHVLFLLAVAVLSSASHQPEVVGDPRLIDRIVRDSAFRSYLAGRRRTADAFNVSLPPDLLLPGVAAEAVRYRTGSLRRYGAVLARFCVAPGVVVVRSRSKRLIVVAQNLGGLSSAYGGYGNLTGVRLVSPVLGIAFYRADAPAKHEAVEIVMTQGPITVDFAGLVERSPGARPLCALFELDGGVSLSDAALSGDACSARRQGHFALVVESSAGEAGRVEREVSGWKVGVALSAVAGALSAMLVGLVVRAVASERRRRLQVEEMERREYEEETLRVSMVGCARAPTAAGVRTVPRLENDEAPPL